MDREECELEFKAELHWLVECVGSCRLLGQELERMGKDWGELDAHPEFLRKAVARGKEEAQESARKTIREVREIMGFRQF